MSTPRYSAEQEAAALGVPLGRVTYAEAGRAQRAACRRANAAEGLRLSDRRLLDAIFGFTTSYSRLADAVTVRQLAAEAGGLSLRQTRRSLSRLRVAGVIVHVSGRGRGNLTLVGVPAAEKAATPSAAFGDEESGQGNGHLSTGEKRTRDEPKSGQDRHRKGDERARAVLSEKEPKKKTAEEQSSATRVDHPEELTRLLHDRFDLTQRQRREVLAAYHEDRDGLARCVWRAIGGRNPSGLLTALVREQAYREPGEDTFEEVTDLLDLIDGCDAAPTMTEACDSTEPEPGGTFWGGLTPDEIADYLYEKHGDLFERPVGRGRL